MIATRLEVRVHMITAATSATQNVVTAVNRAGVHVDDTVFEPLACADSVLRSDERELGICLADIGAGSTNVLVIQEGSVAHSAVLPVGGDHFTSDLSVGLCTPIIEAEKIKKSFGNTVVTLIPEGNEIEVPWSETVRRAWCRSAWSEKSLSHGPASSSRCCAKICATSGCWNICAAGLVLSGGGARLPGIMDVADSVLRIPMRMAWPVPMAKMPSSLAEPEFATVLGMVVYGHRARSARGTQDDALEFAVESDVCGAGSVKTVASGISCSAAASCELRASSNENQSSRR